MKPWIERQRHLIDFTAQSLARRKGKSLGLLFVYTLLVFVLASVALYTHALRNEATRVLAGAPEIVLQRLIAGRHDLVPPGYIERIGRIRGVQKIEGRLWGYLFDTSTGANYTLQVPTASAAGLAPGVALPPNSSLPRINGGRPRTNEYLFDGISVLQPEPGLSGAARGDVEDPRSARSEERARLGLLRSAARTVRPTAAAARAAADWLSAEATPSANALAVRAGARSAATTAAAPARAARSRTGSSS